ncbi:hypothetical protein [Megasphaera elsdenii]|uniref:hypothetical protein n=1 Tax=Megasphaera elsdenii TaxID=907 RepID=UPI001F43CA70|nr:hypothetical protein [Megasphaera elsdenii]MCI5658454.1 hypothetical protein [Megasphaera elsdenii]MDY4728312.1 hypothetical protein [Megasphaera elsdenii]
MFFADGLAGLLIGACLLMTALGLSLQAIQWHQQARQRQLAAMVCRQVMEAWKGGCPPPSRVVLEGRSYEVVSQQTERDGGLILRYVEAGDDHGLRVSCRLLAPEKTGEERLDSLRRAPGLEPVRPDPDGPAAPGRTDGPAGPALSD